MFRFPRALWILVSLLAPAVALAQPFPGTSVVPPSIRVVTPRAGGADPTAVYTVVVNDFFGFPIPGVPVTLDFTGCPHVDPASEQSFPGMSVVSCDPTVLSAVTNFLGEASFLVQGSVVSRGAAGTGAGCVLVSAGAPPIPLGATSPAAYDQDGVNGLTANDLSLILCDLFAGPPFNVRSDVNGDGTLTPLDFVNWFNQYLGASGTSRTPERCDGGAVTTANNPVAAPTLRLRWSDCAANGGTQTAVFACNTNLGSSVLEASFVAPVGVDAMTGFQADLAVVGDPTVPLGAWWRIDPAGCRPTASILVLDYFDPVGDCPHVGEVEGVSWVGLRQMVDTTANPSRARIRIVGAFNPPGLALNAGQEYSIFRLSVNHTRTVGGTACAGCASRVEFLFSGLRLTQPATAGGGCLSPPGPGPGTEAFTGDFVITPDLGSTEWTAYWQGVPPGLPALESPPPSAPTDLALWSENPSRGPTAVRLSLPRSTRCTLALFDVTGRRRRSLLEESLPAGTRTLTWDGRDDQGRPLASGYYVLRLTTEDGAIARPIIRLD